MTQSSSIMLLGFTRQDASRPVDAQAHLHIDLGGICALASQPTMPPPQGADERTEWETSLILMQNAVLSAYVAHTDVMPARFGSFFSDPQALQGALLARADDLQQALDTIAEAQEFALKIRTGLGGQDAVALHPATPASGRDYMSMRLRDRQGRTRTQEQRSEFLSDAMARVSRVTTAVTTGATDAETLLNLSLLTKRGEADALIACARDLYETGALLGCEVSLSGPWPPYSFVPVDGSALEVSL